MTVADQSDKFDVCIIGAGPAGLAALSAVLEPYSMDQLGAAQGLRAATALGKRQDLSTPRVCVVDGHPWMSTWRQRFQHLNIEWLRSPTIAHPDTFDAGAMLAFAGKNERTKELLESGCVDRKLRQLQEASDGSWHLPSNKLFMDFCDDLVTKLPHEFITGLAAGIKGSDGDYMVELDNGKLVNCETLVLALGVPGPPVIPPCIASLPERVMFHSDCKTGKRLEELGTQGRRKVLVLGGGLTAVQVALLGVDRKCKVTLCSRRPLTTRHFDIEKGWFDKREAARHRYAFFSMPLQERLALIKQSRGGGSVPPFYMDQVRQAEAYGSLSMEVCEVQVSEVLEDGVLMDIGGRTERFDVVVAACGHRPDCTQLSAVRSLLEHSSTEITGGFPHLSQDLQWGTHKQLFVIGALASLQVGPDAGNLMGIRRAAQTLTSIMGVREWLRDALEKDESTLSLKHNIRGNQYGALQGDGEEDSDSNESEKENEEEINAIREMKKAVAAANFGMAAKRRVNGKRQGGRKGRAFNKNAR